MIFHCSEVLNSGSLLKGCRSSRVGRSRREFKSKNEERQAGGGFYSVYSVQRRSEALVVFSAFSVVRMHRNGRVSSLFSTELRFPKLDVAGSIPVSRSMFSMTWEVFDCLSFNAITALSSRSPRGARLEGVTSTF